MKQALKTKNTAHKMTTPKHPKPLPKSPKHPPPYLPPEKTQTHANTQKTITKEQAKITESTNPNDHSNGSSKTSIRKVQRARN